MIYVKDAENKQRGDTASDIGDLRRRDNPQTNSSIICVLLSDRVYSSTVNIQQHAALTRLCNITYHTRAVGNNLWSAKRLVHTAFR